MNNNNDNHGTLTTVTNEQHTHKLTLLHRCHLCKLYETKFSVMLRCFICSSHRFSLVHCVSHDSKHYNCDWRSEYCSFWHLFLFNATKWRGKKTDANVGASCQSIINTRMPQWIHSLRARIFLLVKKNKNHCTMFQATDNVLKNMGWVPNWFYSLVNFSWWCEIRFI